MAKIATQPEQSSQVTTAPSLEPVTLAEAKMQLRVGTPGATAASITVANPGVVTKLNHGLATNDVLTWTAAAGMVELNGVSTTVTFISIDTFSIGNTTGYTASTGVESYSVDHDDDDAILQKIIAARKQVEHDEGRSHITQTITLKMDRFPAGNFFTLPRPRLITVSSIKYIDEDETEQTFAASKYVVDTFSEPGRVALASGEAWPTTYGEINDVEVIYTAGWGAAASDVPAETKEAILLLLGDGYDLRGRQIENVTLSDNKAYKSSIQVNRVEIYA